MSDENGQDAQATPPATTPDATPPAAPVEPAQQKPADDDEGKTFSADYVKELREEAKQNRLTAQKLQKQIDDLTKAQDSAKQKELAEQGKYKELADDAMNKLQQLEPYKEQAERYQGVISNLLETQRQGLPESIAALLDKLDPVDQLEWIANNKATVTATPANDQQAQQPPALAQFNPRGDGQVTETDAQRISRLRKTAGQTTSPFGSQNN